MRDIVIVGAGLAGASLACALKNSDLQIAVIDAKPVPHTFEHFDRPIALSYRSKEILENFGLWETLKHHAHPIKHIYVSTHRQFGKTRLHAKDQHLEALGYNILLSTLTHALQKMMLEQSHIELLCPMRLDTIDGITLHCGEKTIDADIIIAADGTQSKVRELIHIESSTINYNETAIIATLELEQDHHHSAYERFTPNGTIAILPLHQKHVELVWVMPTPEAKKYLGLSDAAFLEALQKNFSGYLLFKKISPRSSYPLTGLTTDKSVHGSVVLLGNAAHTLHPIAAQGFNLALRNTQLLANILMSDGKYTLAEYDALAKKSQEKTRRLTSTIRNLFTAHFPGNNTTRSFLLQAFDVCPLAKNKFTWQSIGYPHS